MKRKESNPNIEQLKLRHVMLRVNQLVKTFSSATALKHVSFSAASGEILGILGPNGAGKTTLLRIITNIISPDEGDILWQHAPMTAEQSRRIGYMPEERGLYKKVKIGDQLIYLSRLKGMSQQEAKKACSHWLEKLNAGSWAEKMPEELSKGMSQKIQFIATVMHSPELIILDEPFSGLDPISAGEMETEIKSLAASGTTILFSTHRLEQVEEFCKNIVIINRGEVILSGNIPALKQQYKKNLFALQTETPIDTTDSFPFVLQPVSPGNYLVHLPERATGNELLQAVISKQYTIRHFSEVLPSLNDIFIQQVKQHNPA